MVSDARDQEAAMLERCAAVARGVVHAAVDQREAHVFMLGGMILSPGLEVQADKLRNVGAEYFSRHLEQALDPNEILRRGWIFDCPRFRDMLTRRIKGQP